MSAIKVRMAQSLKAFGLHPRSEVQNLEQQLAEMRSRLQQRNQQLETRNTQLEKRNGQLQQTQGRLEQRNEQLQDRNGRLQNRNEQLQNRNKQLQNRNEQLGAGPSRKFQDVEDEPLWHRRAIGGRWEEIGQLQLDFLRERGLQPQHHLLDVGCGSLRGGVRFIPYLEAGHYFGVDSNERLLDAGRTEVEAANLQDHQPHLAQMEDFDFGRLDQHFDFALANSLFTHLSLNSIVRCLVNVDQVLRPREEGGGVFYATFFENPSGKTYLDPVEQGDGFFSFCDKDPFHYSRDMLEWACEGTGLTASYVGDWGHPRHQVMMEFRKSGSTNGGNGPMQP